MAVDTENYRTGQLRLDAAERYRKVGFPFYYFTDDQAGAPNFPTVCQAKESPVRRGTTR